MTPVWDARGSGTPIWGCPQSGMPWVGMTCTRMPLFGSLQVRIPCLGASSLGCPGSGFPLGQAPPGWDAPGLGCSWVGNPPVWDPSVWADPASRYPQFGDALIWEPPGWGVPPGLFPVLDDPALGCPGLGSPGSGPLGLRYLQFGSPQFGMPGGAMPGAVAQKLDSGTVGRHSRPRCSVVPGGPQAGRGGPLAPLPSEAERCRCLSERRGRLAELCERFMATGLEDRCAGGKPASPSGCGGLGWWSPPVPSPLRSRLLWFLGAWRRVPSAPTLAARRGVGTRRGCRGARGVPGSSCPLLGCFGGPAGGGLGVGGVSGPLSPPVPSGRRERRVQRGRRPDSRYATSPPGTPSRPRSLLEKDQRGGTATGGALAGGSFTLRLRPWTPRTKGLASKPPAIKNIIRGGGGGLEPLWGAGSGGGGITITFLQGSGGIRGARRGGLGSRVTRRCGVPCAGAQARQPVGTCGSRRVGRVTATLHPQGAQHWGALGCTRCKSTCESAQVHGGCEWAVLCVLCGCSLKHLCALAPPHVLACVPTLVCSSMHRYVHVCTWLAGTGTRAPGHARAYQGMFSCTTCAQPCIHRCVCTCVCVHLSASLSLHRCACMSVCVHHAVCKC